MIFENHGSPQEKPSGERVKRSHIIAIIISHFGKKSIGESNFLTCGVIATANTKVLPLRRPVETQSKRREAPAFFFVNRRASRLCFPARCGLPPKAFLRLPLFVREAPCAKRNKPHQNICCLRFGVRSSAFAHLLSYLFSSSSCLEEVLPLFFKKNKPDTKNRKKRYKTASRQRRWGRHGAFV